MEERRITTPMPATPEMLTAFIIQERRKLNAQSKRDRKAAKRAKQSRKVNR